MISTERILQLCLRCWGRGCNQCSGKGVLKYQQRATGRRARRKESDERGAIRDSALDPNTGRLVLARRRQTRLNHISIHLGIKCGRCGTVHFIATSNNIQRSRSALDVYSLGCPPPCSETQEFSREGMGLYRVAFDVLKQGHAVHGEYEMLPQRLKPAGFD